MKRHHINDLTTFSVGFSDARFDEREYQKQMVAHRAPIRACSDGAAPSERDEMALVTIASLQLLPHLFIEKFEPVGSREAA